MSKHSPMIQSRQHHHFSRINLTFIQYSLAAATQCGPCVAGSYSATSGSSSCANCVVGTFAAAAGASACTTCLAGTYKDSEGSVLLPSNPDASP